MRIGILGGTFNPVHNGHLHLAKQTLKELRLDKVIFVPAYIPPHKKIGGNIKAEDRLRMLHLAVDRDKRFAISMYEIKEKGKSYSIKTARFFKRKYGRKAVLFFLIGADSLKGLRKWKDIKCLKGIVQFAVAPRSGFKMEKDFADILKVDIPEKDISSTKIRRLVRGGRSIKRFVPERVYRYIEENKLYTK